MGLSHVNFKISLHFFHALCDFPSPVDSLSWQAVL